MVSTCLVESGKFHTQAMYGVCSVYKENQNKMASPTVMEGRTEMQRDLQNENMLPMVEMNGLGRTHLL